MAGFAILHHACDYKRRGHPRILMWGIATDTATFIHDCMANAWDTINRHVFQLMNMYLGAEKWDETDTVPGCQHCWKELLPQLYNPTNRTLHAECPHCSGKYTMPLSTFVSCLEWSMEDSEFKPFSIECLGEPVAPFQPSLSPPAPPAGLSDPDKDEDEDKHGS